MVQHCALLLFVVRVCSWNRCAWRPAALVAACNMIEDFEECGTSITSPYDPSKPACFWDPDVDPRCAMIEPDPESWTIERIMAILICASSSRVVLTRLVVCELACVCVCVC